MDCWITYAGKRSECYGCKMPIKVHDLIICGKFHNKEGRKAKTVRWHAINSEGKCCWIEEGKLKLDKESLAKSETRGRKRILQLSEQDRSARRAILKQRASVVQRIRSTAKKGKLDIDSLTHLGLLLYKYGCDIAKLGGIPASWNKGGLSNAKKGKGA